MRLLLALAALAAPATSQTVLLHESFENGLAGWTATGLWNAQTTGNGCGTAAAPFPDGIGAAWYGDPTSCTYETVGSANSGTLIMDAWVDLPAGAASISLHYWSRSQTEYCWQGWDNHRVFVEVQGGGAFSIPYCDDPVPASTDLGWHERRGDLTSLAGRRVRPRFEFLTGDDAENQYLGWFLDDLTLEVEPGVRMCPLGGLASGCPCVTSQAEIPVAGGCRNSTDQSAVLISSGSPVVSADTLRIDARNLPPNASCLLAQAPALGATITFGDGRRCVSGSVMRMGAVQASNGNASWPPAGTDPIATRGSVPAAGGTRYYYVYYRDVLPYCTAATFNLTDTQRIVWTP